MTAVAPSLATFTSKTNNNNNNSSSSATNKNNHFLTFIPSYGPSLSQSVVAAQRSLYTPLPKFNNGSRICNHNKNNVNGDNDDNDDDDARGEENLKNIHNQSSGHTIVINAFHMEHIAASIIQSTYQMYTQRNVFLLQKRSATKIQSCYRSHLTRRAAHEENKNKSNQTQQLSSTFTLTKSNNVHENNKRYEAAIFFYYAQQIQKMFRGFLSRKHKNNYYAQKAYIAQVTKEGEKIKTMSEAVKRETDQLLQIKENLQREREYQNATAKAHFLLSTDSVKGVYHVAEEDHNNNNKSASKSEKGNVITLISEDDDDATEMDNENGSDSRKFNTNKIEDDIRHNTREARRPGLEATIAKKSHEPFPFNNNNNNNNNSITKKKATTTSTAAASYSEDMLRKYKMQQQQQQQQGNTNSTQKNETAHFSSSLPPLKHKVNNLSPERPDGRKKKTDEIVFEKKKAETAGDGGSGCAWENADVQPPPKPIISAENTIVKKKKNTLANRNIASTAMSSTSKKFKVASHDCTAHDDRYDSNNNNNKSYEQSTYDTEKEKLTKSTDQKVIEQLHAKSTFKVPAGRGENYYNKK